MPTIVYTDSSGNHLWSDPINWNIGTVPIAIDDVIIQNGTIIIDSPNPQGHTLSFTGPGNINIILPEKLHKPIKNRFDCLEL